jgi:hypothetical protein
MSHNKQTTVIILICLRSDLLPKNINWDKENVTKLTKKFEAITQNSSNSTTNFNHNNQNNNNNQKNGGQVKKLAATE